MEAEGGNQKERLISTPILLFLFYVYDTRY